MISGLFCFSLAVISSIYFYSYTFDLFGSFCSITAASDAARKGHVSLHCGASLDAGNGTGKAVRLSHPRAVFVAGVPRVISFVLCPPLLGSGLGLLHCGTLDCWSLHPAANTGSGGCSCGFGCVRTGWAGLDTSLE